MVGCCREGEASDASGADASGADASGADASGSGEAAGEAREGGRGTDRSGGPNNRRPERSGDRPKGPPRHDRQNRDRQDRHDRHGGGSGGSALRQFASSEKPRGRDKAPDPDSPFAKLAALKQQLENKDGKN